eukprot:9368830-Lingulodinium_polyedra.AAC.1
MAAWKMRPITYESAGASKRMPQNCVPMTMESTSCGTLNNLLEAHACERNRLQLCVRAEDRCT